MRIHNILIVSLSCIVLLSTPTVWSATPEGLVHQWIFDMNHCNGPQFKPVAGELAADITGPVHIDSVNKPSAIFINKEINKISVNYDEAKDTLPREAVTAEAWLSIEKTMEWCEIVGITKGDFGWQLGLRQSSFSFGVGTQESENKKHKMIHTRARPSLNWGEWYHVVGTFDGETAKIYVNGKLEKESAIPKGPIYYESGSKYTIGQNGNFYWRGLLHEVGVYNRALSQDEITARYNAKKDLFPCVLDFKVDPMLTRDNKDSVTITWETKSPSPSMISFGHELPLNKSKLMPDPKTAHEVSFNTLVPETVHYYRIQSQDKNGKITSSRLFEYDSTFDYTPVEVKIGTSPYPKDELTAVYEKAAQDIVAQTDFNRGYCLVLGCGEGRLMYELAKRTRMQIVGVDPDESNIQKTRQALNKAGIYGIQATVKQGSLDVLPYGAYFANIITSDNLLIKGELPPSADEMFRVLRPCGGVAYLGQASKTGKKIGESELRLWLGETLAADAEFIDNDGTFVRLQRGVLPGSGDWTHQYADAGKSSNSKDQYVTDDMGVLWYGRPGPRPMVDRGTRAPAPLAVDGRLYVQGDRKLFGLDAYNGTINWVVEIPDLRRANMPRDCGNMTATSDALYLAIHDTCWIMDGKTGKRTNLFDIPHTSKNQPYEWGYIAAVGDHLFGSGVKKGGIYIGADGEWYDRSDEESDKVISDYLFSMDRNTGQLQWEYRGGAVMNSTICFGEGRIYFVESRNPEALALDTGRIGHELTKNMFLVAIDSETGQTVWERETDLNDCRWVLHLSYSDNMLVAISTSDIYHIYGFSALDGKPMWKDEYKMAKNHHGGAMQHPAILNGKIYAEPQVYDLFTGERREKEPPERRGCGGVSACTGYVLGRHNYFSFLNLETNTRVQWIGMRAGCWVGMIPAEGLVLAPESSAGCHCGIPIQSSIAWISRDQRQSLN